MKKLFLFGAVAFFILWMANCKPAAKSAVSSSPATAAQPATTPQAAPDPLAAERKKYLDAVRKSIAGKEKMPIDSAFKNMKMFKGFPAENLVNIMDRWSQALGVSCNHCHVENEWHQDVKPEKEIARQMITFNTKVNEDIGKLSAVKTEKAGVSCYTCHRGEAKPARRPK